MKSKRKLSMVDAVSMFVPSRSVARRLMQQGVVKVDGRKASDISEVINVPATITIGQNSYRVGE